MRDGFIFYASFYDAISDLGKQQQQKIFDAICRYALFDEEPELSGALSTAFKLIRPQLDANTRRYENGKKGGRPVNSTRSEDEKKSEKTEVKPNQNQKETKEESTPKQTKPKYKEKEKEKDKDKEKVNVKDNNKQKGLGSGSVSSGGSEKSPNDFDFRSGMSPDDIDAIYESYPQSGGFLIDEVAKDAMRKRKHIERPVPYIIGYAKNIGWDDLADQTWQTT